VELGDLSVEPLQVAHPPDGLDRLAIAEDERVLEHLDLAERRPTQRDALPRRRRELREVAHEEPRASVGHARPGARGIRSPPSSAGGPASGWPGGRCGRTRGPGWVASRRSSRSACASLPSARTTSPAWMALPIPTPPPWWTLPHVAPAATLTSALRIGQ